MFLTVTGNDGPPEQARNKVGHFMVDPSLVGLLLDSLQRALSGGSRLYEIIVPCRDVLNRDIGAVIPPGLSRYANFQPLGRIDDRRAEGRTMRLHVLPDGPRRFPGRELDRRGMDMDRHQPEPRRPAVLDIEEEDE